MAVTNGATLASKSASKPTKVEEIKFCQFCQKQRRGERLAKHCHDSHAGQYPIGICTTEVGEYSKAAKLLREHGFKITTLPGVR